MLQHDDLCFKKLRVLYLLSTENISSVWTVNLNHKNACGRACIRFEYWNFHILSSLMNDSFRSFEYNFYYKFECFVRNLKFKPLSSYRNNINEKKSTFLKVHSWAPQISLLWSTFLQRLLKAERLEELSRHK